MATKPFKFRYVNEITGVFVLLIVALLVAGIILAGRAQAGNNGVGVIGVEGEKVEHVRLGGRAVPFGIVGCVACGIDQRLPLVLAADRHVQHEIEGDVHKSRDIFRALDVAAHPVN